MLLLLYFIEQFKKLKKYQDERVKQYFEKINSEKNIIFGDIYNVIKLISINFETQKLI